MTKSEEPQFRSEQSSTFCLRGYISFHSIQDFARSGRFTCQVILGANVSPFSLFLSTAAFCHSHWSFVISLLNNVILGSFPLFFQTLAKNIRKNGRKDEVGDSRIIFIYCAWRKLAQKLAFWTVYMQQKYRAESLFQISPMIKIQDSI